MHKNYNSIALLIFIIGLCSALYVNKSVQPTWLEQSYIYDIYQTDNNEPAYIFKGQEVVINNVVPYQNSPLTQDNLNKVKTKPELAQQWVSDANEQIKLLKPAFHYGLWSLLPAFITISLCLLTKEPLTALFGGIVVGAFMLGQYDLTEKEISWLNLKS